MQNIRLGCCQLATYAVIILEVNNTRSYIMTISDETYEALNDVIVIYIKEINTSLKLIVARLNDIEEKIDDIDSDIIDLDIPCLDGIEGEISNLQSEISSVSSMVSDIPTEGCGCNS